jgi:hypothetical protein
VDFPSCSSRNGIKTNKEKNTTPAPRKIPLQP